jgi:23S rRNA (uracil1939-C5)-methyltransferase
MPTLNRRFRGTCIDYTHDGKGVFKIDQLPVFIENILVGEEADILITNHRGKYAEGRIEKRYTTSSQRVIPPCPFYEACGGCQIQHLSYSEQLKMKKSRVAEVLRRMGDYNGKVMDIIPSEIPFQYRNKVQFPFGKNDKGELITGLYRKGTHQIIDIDQCLIEQADADQIVQAVKAFCIEHHLEPYDQKYKKGFLRHVMVRKATATGEVMVVLVTGKVNFPQKHAFVEDLQNKFPQIKTIIQNINPEFTDVVLGYREHILFGPGFIEDVLGGLRFKIAAKSFYQVNPVQTEKLYAKALELANIQATDLVLDAYSGVGTMTLLAAQRAKHVTGVEIVKDAVINAIENAKANHIKNVSFIEADAAPYMVERTSKGKQYDVVIVDPPRQGCSTEFLNALKIMKPKRFVYVSCEPSSLARDIKILSDFYEVKVVQPVDMFSQTYHVETVVLLELKNR